MGKKSERHGNKVTWIKLHDERHKIAGDISLCELENLHLVKKKNSEQMNDTVESSL